MITLKHLAKKLNVSVSTVSKSLNDSPEISKITKDRVKALAKYYNFRPNKTALNLRQSNTNTIGVVIPSILNRFFARVLFGIEAEATKQGYNIITCMSNELLSNEVKSLDILSNGSVDGIILSLAEETQSLEEVGHLNSLLKQKLPIVLFDRVLEIVNCDKVLINDFEAAYDATKQLLLKGRNNLVFISQIHNLHLGKKRFEGFSKAIKDSKLEIEVKKLAISNGNKANSDIANFLKKHKNTNGVLSADNLSGTIAINVARHLGIHVPQEMSVIGFCDEAISNMSIPKLAHINQNAEQIGRETINILIKRIHNKEKHDNIYIKKIVTYSINKEGSL